VSTQTVIRKPSVQSLYIEMSIDGTKLSSGTAFVVDTAKGPHLITNRHNVTGRDQNTGQPLSPTAGIPNQINIWHNASSGLGAWQSCFEILLKPDGSPRWIEHPILGARADFVALPLVHTAGISLIPHSLIHTGPDFVVGPADTVSVIGFPFGMAAGGLFALWATGFVASEPDVDINGLPVMYVDCRSRPGQSGSPVLAYRWGGAAQIRDGSTAVITGEFSRFIGIYSGRLNKDSDIGIVWKASAIAELINAL